MSRRFALLICLGLAFSLSSTVVATPAQNADDCEAAALETDAVDYNFSNVMGLRTCWIETEDVEIDEQQTVPVVVRAAGLSTRGWRVIVERTDFIVTTYRTTWTRQGTTRTGPTTVQVGDPVVIEGAAQVIECYNPGGREFDLSHTHCQYEPPAE